jgi:hypothetical protein
MHISYLNLLDPQHHYLRENWNNFHCHTELTGGCPDGTSTACQLVVDNDDFSVEDDDSFLGCMYVADIARVRRLQCNDGDVIILSTSKGQLRFTVSGYEDTNPYYQLPSHSRDDCTCAFYLAALLSMCLSALLCRQPRQWAATVGSGTTTADG